MEVAEVWAKGGEGAEKLAILAAKVAEQCVCKTKTALRMELGYHKRK